ncbi:glucosyltransferase domain-containing protein [Ochrobactrum soli]|uniref:Phage protein n=1 Tax=Ochrobactrum soli TaxID=2448455 RepID=A0A2P9HKX6_9HYPH|nr:glucosyltransferase domain-containing protein [[Ochrobactrum] soli]SPL64794.1 Phage protein [[Ochrobactrum] soli]
MIDLTLNKKTAFIAFAITIAYFSILRHGLSYTDDHIRIITGNSLFLYVGRPIAEAMTLFASWGKPVFDASPLSQFIAIGALVFFCIAYFNTISDIPAYIAICASITIGLNPMIMENMSYKFDAAPMIVSLCLAAAPMYFPWTGVRYFLLTSFFLLLSFMTYQAGVSAFIASVSGGIVISILNNDDFKNYIRKTLVNALCLLFSGLLYKIIIILFFNRFLYDGSWGGVHSKIVNTDNVIVSLYNNYIAYFYFIYENIINSPFGFSYITILLFFLFTVIFRLLDSDCIYQWYFKLPLLIFAIFVLITSPLGLQFILNSPVIQPRTLYVFGLVTAILIYIGFRFHKYNIVKRVMILPIFTLLFQSLSFAFLVGNIQSQQNRWESLIASSLVNDLASASKAYGNKIQLQGTLKYSPESQLSISKYSLLNYIARYHIGDIWTFPAFLSSAGLKLDILPSTPTFNGDKILLSNGLGYSIYRKDNDGTLLLVFEQLE